MWKIKKTVSKGDYTYAVVTEHPRCTINGYVLEHRVVMENYLGRLLCQDEVVHHIDHNKKNNDIENLELYIRTEHTREHMFEQGIKMVTLCCPECGKKFNRRLVQTHIIKKNKNVHFVVEAVQLCSIVIYNFME